MNMVAHHLRSIRTAYAAENARAAGRAERSLHPEFLPAVLEVIERPVSATSRLTAWTLLVALVAALLWLTLGRVDVVASAQGTTAPTDSTKVVQSASDGVVRRLFVHEGEHVRRGQPLIDLDPTGARADQAKAAAALLAAQLDVARNRAVIDGLSGGSGRYVAPAGTAAEVVRTQQRLVAAQLAVARSTAAEARSAQRSAQSDAQAAAAQLGTYGDTVGLLDRQVSAIEELARKGYASQLRLIELQRQRRAEEGQRTVAAAQQSRGLAEVRRYGQEALRSTQDARQHALSDLAAGEAEVALRSQELLKAQRQLGLQQLVAPVDGTVQQLAVHTVGGVVPAAQPLMVVVPEGSLIVEARLLNRDIGLVRQGQRATVKFDAYPSTRYGAMEGHVVSVSRDAVREDNKLPYFIVRVALDRRDIAVDGRRIPLTAGLSSTVDIQFRSRSIMSYLLDPITAGLGEAGKEH